MSDQSADGIWADVTARLREDLSETAFSAWFGSAQPVSLEGSRLRIGVPNEFTRAWIDGHFAQLVERAARSAHDELAVEFTVSDRARPAAALRPATASGEAASPASSRRSAARRSTTPAASSRSTRSTTSSSARRTASRTPPRSPSPRRRPQAYNPLFIYGGTGLGKTHLLQAIGHYVEQHARRCASRYVTSEQFTNEFIDALRDKRDRRVQAALPQPSTCCSSTTSSSSRASSDPGGVLPHVQRALRGRPPDRPLARTARRRNRRARGAAALALRVGPDHRRPAAGPRDAHRDPAQARARPTALARRPRRAHRHRAAGDQRTSASSRARSPACWPTPR